MGVAGNEGGGAPPINGEFVRNVQKGGDFKPYSKGGRKKGGLEGLYLEGEVMREKLQTWVLKTVVTRKGNCERLHKTQKIVGEKRGGCRFVLGRPTTEKIFGTFGRILIVRGGGGRFKRL